MTKATHKQTFISVWFHDDKLSSDQQHKMKNFLDHTFFYYQIFVDTLAFTSFIDEKKLVTKIFLIISMSGLSSLPMIRLAQEKKKVFEEIYALSPIELQTTSCFNTTNIDDLFVKISTDVNAKMNLSSHVEDELGIKPESITMDDIDKSLPPLTLFNSELTHTTRFQHLTKESVKFVSSLILRDILIQGSYGDKELEEMCANCRGLYENDTAELKHIDEFQKEYKAENAIEYYKSPWFLYHTITKVCGSENMEEIYKFRIYIRHLHEKLSQLNDEQEQSELKPSIVKVYRGQLIAGSVLQQLMDNRGRLIAINGFLSTTTDRKLALTYAGYKENKVQGMHSVLFRLKILNEVSPPYAFISMDGKMKDESEVLFSLGTIWRIKSVKGNKKLYTIELSSCEEDNLKFTRLFGKYTGKNASLMSLGDILLGFGNEDKAEWCYRKMLDQQCNDDKRTGILYYKIGMMQFEKKLYDTALINFRRAKRLLRRSEDKFNKLRSSRCIDKYCSQLPLLKICHRIGMILERNARFEAAVNNYKQALNKKCPRSELATVHNTLGLLHFRRGNFNAAFVNQRKACKCASKSHPYLMHFNKSLKRTINYLNYIRKNEGNKRKKRKTI